MTGRTHAITSRARLPLRRLGPEAAGASCCRFGAVLRRPGESEGSDVPCAMSTFVGVSPFPLELLTSSPLALSA